MDDHSILFDEEFIANNRPGVHLRPLVFRACHELTEYKESLENWFTHIPPARRLMLKNQILEESDPNHLSGVYELFLHEQLRQTGWKFEKEPIFDEQEPDFLVEAPNGVTFLLESTTIKEPRNTYWMRHAVLKVVDYLEKFSFDFPIRIELNSWKSADSPHSGKIATRVVHEVRHRKPSKLDAPYTLPLNEHGIDGILLAYPSEKVCSPNVTIVPPTNEIYLTKELIARRIRNKMKHYNKIKLPIVVAIMTTDFYPMTDSELHKTLFGDGESFPGLFNPYKPGRPALNRNLLGVLHCTTNVEGKGVRFIQRVIKNPNAKFDVLLECLATS